MSIFDYLTIDELLNVAESSAQFNHLITDHFLNGKYHFREKTICFGISALEHCDFNQNAITTPNFERFNGIAGFLHNFNHLITKIDLSLFGMSEEESIVIGQILNNCCSNTLLEITVRLVNDDFIEIMDKPFVNANVVNLFWPSITDRQRLGWLFPNVKRIELISIRSRDLSVFNQRFEQLEYLDYGVNRYDQYYMTDMMYKNPQLKGVTIRNVLSMEDLNQISVLLPQLEQLQLLSEYYFNSSSPTIQFNRLKELTISGNNVHFPLNLPQLEALTIQTSSIENWINVIIQHSHLKRLTIERSLLSSAQLLALSNALHDLEEITIGWVYGHNDGIRTFMQNHSTFKMITFVLSDARNIQPLQETIPDDRWELANFRKLYGGALASFVPI